MAKTRKDNKGRALQKGESQRQSDLMYIYAYMDPLQKRRYIYSKDLVKLREREKKAIERSIRWSGYLCCGKSRFKFCI